MQTQRERFGLVPWIVGIVIVAAIGFGFFRKAVAFSETNGASDGAPVVLELFTSEGCSSCPPADALISELGSSTKSVIPLAYHVDYWNHLGWADPFSSRQWSERQSDYARAMNLDGEYTPQMVIGGGWQCGGSDAGSIERAVAAARSASPLGRTSIQTSLADCGVSKTSGQSHRANVEYCGDRTARSDAGDLRERSGQQDWRRRERWPRNHLRLHREEIDCRHLSLTAQKAPLSARNSPLTSTIPGH